MCGRYALSATATELIEYFQLLACPDFGPHYNIASQSQIPIIRFKPYTGSVGQFVRWGLIPSWAKDPSIGNKLNNARVETVPTVYVREQPLSVCARQGEHLARGGWTVQLGNHVG